MPPHASPRRPQFSDLAATASLAWSLAAAAGFAFIAVHWPHIPPMLAEAPPTAAWIAWGAALAYVAATAALHARLSVLARGSPQRLSPFACSLPAVGHGAVIVAGGWNLAAGSGSLVLMSGLGSATATAAVIGAVSLPLAVLLGRAARRQSASDGGLPPATVLSAVCALAGVALAAMLLLIQFGVGTV